MTGTPATTKVPSASNRAVAMSSAAAPNSAVVTSCDARSSASARRTTSPGSRSCVRSANRQHPVDRAAGALRDGGGNPHLVLQVAQRVPQLGERNLLHVPSRDQFRRGDKFLLGIVAP